jgi:hypothetical protein
MRLQSPEILLGKCALRDRLLKLTVRDHGSAFLAASISQHPQLVGGGGRQ